MFAGFWSCPGGVPGDRGLGAEDEGDEGLATWHGNRKETMFEFEDQDHLLYTYIYL